MTVLVPMGADDFGPYVKAAVADYAVDNIICGRWPESTAAVRSQEAFASLLPLGLATPHNFIFNILSAPQGDVVGALWFAVVDPDNSPSAYVYNLWIDPAHRRQGHALRAFQALEQRVGEMGLSRIGLHVFGHNGGAQALYRCLGYGMTGISMAKRLKDTSA